jgi:flagellin
LSSSTGTLTVAGTDAAALGLDGTVSDQSLNLSEVSVATVFNANNALVTIDGAIDQVTSLRAELGAMQNRFENVVEVIGIHRENLEAARSRILDADFAAETANLTRAQILQQAGLSSLAQANSVPQSVLSLLQ